MANQRHAFSIHQSPFPGGSITDKPPPPPAPWLPPLEPEDIADAARNAIERMRPMMQDFWDSRMRYYLGFLDGLPSELQFQFYHSREPWFLIHPPQAPMDAPRLVAAPWLAELASLSDVEVNKHMRRYAELLEERGFTSSAVLDLQAFEREFG